MQYMYLTAKIVSSWIFNKYTWSLYFSLGVIFIEEDFFYVVYGQATVFMYINWQEEKLHASFWYC
jgi:hypothetical protein